MLKRFMNKKSLAVSLLSALLCLVLFVGVTFAWFTDEEEAGVQIITFGDLSVEIHVDDEENSGSTRALNEGEELEFVGFENADYSQWEAGGTNTLEDFYVVNTGDTDLTFTITITEPSTTSVDGDGNLLESPITWSLETAGMELELDDNLTTVKEIQVKAGKTSAELTVVGVCDDSLSDYYNAVEFSKMKITVTATQTG